MKKIGILLASFAFMLVIGTSCKEKIPPVSDRIKKNWTPQIVKEGSTTVYTKGGTTNTKPGYSNFSLNLTAAPSASLKEVDASTFNGSYTLPSDVKLVLSGLTPQPTGSGGTIEFNIISLNNEGTQLVIARTTASQKTGGTINEYTLVSQ